MSETRFSGNCFPDENSWTESTSPWTTPARSTVDRRPLPLSGARPPAAPVPESSDRGVGERKGGPVDSLAGLTRLGRRWKGVSPAVELRSQEDDGEGAVRAKIEGVDGVGCFTEGRVGFYRAEARPSVFNGQR
jgi:hypothetical protein